MLLLVPIVLLKVRTFIMLNIIHNSTCERKQALWY